MDPGEKERMRNLRLRALGLIGDFEEDNNGGALNQEAAFMENLEVPETQEKQDNLAVAVVPMSLSQQPAVMNISLALSKLL